jgi:nitrite reductase/ring-hydroxylating ferredoxin subunit
MPFESTESDTTTEPHSAMTLPAAHPDQAPVELGGAPAEAEVINLDPHRRNVLRGAAAAGVAVCAFGLSACTSASSSGSNGMSSTGNESSGGASPAPSASSSSGGGINLGPASAIPVGGGKAFTDQQILVTQPAKGEYKAFTAVCTHQQCIINEVSGGTMNCPCHGSKFSITDGSVKAGPAPSPVAAKTVTVTNGDIIVS